MRSSIKCMAKSNLKQLSPLAERLEGKNVILASASPRRRELLAQLGITFYQGSVADYDENYPASLSPFEVAEYICKEKSLHYYGCATLGTTDGYLADNHILITSDTVVILGNQILGKPKERAEAIDMISSLGGKSHNVVTAVCIRDNRRTISFSDICKVEFARLDKEEIEYYVDTFKPYDKAGGYAIQEWIGLAGIKSISGNIYTVIGLPTQRLYKELLNF